MSDIEEYNKRMKEFETEYRFCLYCQRGGLVRPFNWTTVVKGVSTYRVLLTEALMQAQKSNSPAVWPARPNLGGITERLPSLTEPAVANTTVSAPPAEEEPPIEQASAERPKTGGSEYLGVTSSNGKTTEEGPETAESSAKTEHRGRRKAKE